MVYRLVVERLRELFASGWWTAVCFCILASFSGLCGFVVGVRTQVVAAPATPVLPWMGDVLGKREGAFYLKVQMKGFASSKAGLDVSQTVQLYLYSIIQKKMYVVSHLMDDNEGTPSSIWRIPSGKYRISKISLVDDAGVSWQWQPKKMSKSFVVHRKTLSNLGMFTLKSSDKKSSLKVSYRMIADSYDSARAKSDHLLTSVINGFNGQVQANIAGQKAFNPPSKEVKARSKLRVEYTFQRKIVMYFMVDLFKHNRYSQSIRKVLDGHDAQFRRCYMEQLDLDGNFDGQLKFKFLLSKSISAMKKIKFGGGSITKPKMVQCLFNELNGLSFPVPETMIGELSFEFKVR
ncbi:MAG: hypothetical protein R3B45_12230 [Bdellovibrionota bacterium]